MAVGGRGNRSNGGGGGGGDGGGGSGVKPASVIVNLFSYRMLILATFSLLFFATVTFLFSSRISYHIHSGLQTRENACSPGNFLSLSSSPSGNTIDFTTEPLVHVYVAYARNLKLEMLRQRKMLAEIVKNYRPSSSSDANTGVDKQFKKVARDKIKVAKSLISKPDESYNSQLKIQKLKDAIFSLNEMLVKAKKNAPLEALIASQSIPTNLHCLAVRLMEARIAQPENFLEIDGVKPEYDDPKLYHYAIFSDNLVAVSVVVNSAAMNAKEPRKHVFHIVTDKLLVSAMKTWFKMRPIHGGAHVEVKSVFDYTFWNKSYVPVLRQLPDLSKSNVNYGRYRNKKLGTPEDLSVLNHLIFYLPEMYPKLNQVVFLEEDVVVQKDMSNLFDIKMDDGMVNGAVETCLDDSFRFDQYLNFSNSLIQENFHPDTCAWALGMNIFNLDAWRRENLTERYHYWQNLNENQTLWRSDTTLPAGLITFQSLTKSLDKSWHVLGLGQHPVISMDEINNATVLHFSGYMKPWLDYSYNQYKHLWDKYFDSDVPLLQMCNLAI